jgi:hypothetical protein
VSETLGFETETKTWVVSDLVLKLETRLLKPESWSLSMRPETKSLSLSIKIETALTKTQGRSKKNVGHNILLIYPLLVVRFWFEKH